MTCPGQKKKRTRKKSHQAGAGGCAIDNITVIIEKKKMPRRKKTAKTTRWCLTPAEFLWGERTCVEVGKEWKRDEKTRHYINTERYSGLK